MDIMRIGVLFFCVACVTVLSASEGLKEERRKPHAANAGGYIPEPRPVRSGIELSALYYPGTEHMPEWDMVKQTLPHIRPLLGWYDEGDPENIDWQIKWAVEHGITSFCVDWYWDRGEQRLDHWVKGFYKARFRRYLKWYVMYANHNSPGDHSSEDQEAVTKWWIDNYFKTPEYYRIDGKPVVVYFSTANLDKDFIDEAARKGEKLAPGEGLRRAFGISERLAREAGLPGIYWMCIAPRPSIPPETLAAWKTGGIKSVTPYTFGGPRVFDIVPEAHGPGDRPRNYSFDVMMAGAEKYWRDNIGLGGDIGYLPMLPTGWDDRPRSFQNSKITHSRTPEKFRKVCEAAREFCRRHGVRRIMVAPINEWQEGSYIEPNDEFGFGMYDAMRDVFCEKPAAGWPPNLTPESIGRPLREFPPMRLSRNQSWTFDDSTEGWYRQPYGCPVTLCKNGALTFVTTRKGNFNIRLRLEPFPASGYSSFSLRMRLRPSTGLPPVTGAAARMRLKWGTTDRPVIDSSLSVNQNRSVASCGVMPDGEWHTYTLDLSRSPDWRGDVNELWFEAVGATHVDVEIDWMKFGPVRR